MSSVEIESRKTGAKPLVLVVDDDLSRLDRLQRSLRGRYDVRTSTSGVEALRLIPGLPNLRVLIVEEDLPRMKGTEILRFVNETAGDADGIIRILMTDVAYDPADGPASIGRIDHVAARPVEPESLRRTVDKLLGRRSREKRAAMRVPVEGRPGIRVEVGIEGAAEVLDLSETGLFLKTHLTLPDASIIPFKFALPEGREHVLTGRVVRRDAELGGFGIEFETPDEAAREALSAFLSDAVTLRDGRGLKERYPFLRIDEMVMFTDSLKIETLVREALRSGIEVAAIPAHARIPEMLAFEEVAPPAFCRLGGQDLDVRFKTSDLVFLSFQIGYATYNFETMISRIGADGRSLECLFPRVMFYSEKRMARRISPRGDLCVEIPLPVPFGRTLRGQVTDISPGGVSLVAETDGPALLAGTPLASVRILDGETFLWEERGEVRHVSRVNGALGPLRYGIQFGISRSGIQTANAPRFETRGGKREPDAAAAPGPVAIPAPAPGPAAAPAPHRRQADLDDLARREPEVIRFENSRGEEIVALLNTSLPLDGRPVPVVVIPPAFGKTKETLFALALTAVQSFRHHGKPLAVVRFDGIRRKGESFKDPEASEPPYEMINATTTQGADDLRAVLDGLRLNSRLKAGPIIIASFSLSALETRIMLRDEAYRRQVDYWIACMGTLEFRDLMRRVNCGLDLLEQYQIGIKLGVRPILGNLIHCEPYAADVVAGGIATLDQAREDMRHLDLPITWIYGQYDNWVKAEFVRDVMSIQAGVPREVISVPIGHNARTSEEALHLFGLITSLLYRFLHHETVAPIPPTARDMEIMRRAEKDRLPSRNLKNRAAYWKRYLVGEDNLLGFDVMALSDDYRQLMRDQLQALDPAPGDRILDLGGGTGNFIEHLLQCGRPLPAHVTIADLIPEGMKQARRKIAHGGTAALEPGRFSLLCLDIELDRYLPVRRFLDGEIGGFDLLADKIENLALQSAEKIRRAYSPRLHRILRGAPITPALDDWLKTTFDLPEVRAVTDFNRAARFVHGLDPNPPAYRSLAFSDSLAGPRRLPFRTGSYDKVLLSLVLSYIFNPLETLVEIRRIIRPGGRLVLSSMRPDTDASGLFTRLLDKIEALPADALPPQWPKARILDSMRSFLNDAQALVELEEAGTFDFFDPKKLEALLEEAGWESAGFRPSFGDPPQGYVVTATPKDGHA
jgi:ubiquinone/menaquinone biosynthesis C-methylase UbiE/CheY-like chemotaxis protein